ncbi:hypothetical protein ACQJBY_031773 [Aegilops geniculata]
MAAAFVSSRSLATTCLLALLLAGCLAVAMPTADARRLLVEAMPPAASPGFAPSPASGAEDGHHAGRSLFEGRGLLAGGLRLAGRLLIGVEL